MNEFYVVLRSNLKVHGFHADDGTFTADIEKASRYKTKREAENAHYGNGGDKIYKVTEQNELTKS